MKKDYLFDGYHIVLTTENGLPDDPSNTIALEPSVIQSLFEYFERLKTVDTIEKGDKI